MSATSRHDTEDLLSALPILARRLEDIHVLRRDLDHDIASVDLTLDELTGAIDMVNQRLTRKKNEPRVAIPPPAPVVVPAPAAPAVAAAPAPAAMTLEDFKLHMGEILKGSLDAVSDKLSDRISNMLKELGTLSGPAREMRIQEFKQSGEYDMVDFSSLYSHSAEQVTSNLKDVGVEEKETKSIDSTLERLRKMRANKPKI